MRVVEPQKRICDDNLNVRYLIDFPNLDLTYFEIPKNASSSTKHYLFSANRGFPNGVSFGLGHVSWFNLFPECRVGKDDPIPQRAMSLVLVRDPVMRIKSSYGNIFKGRMKETATFKGFLENYFVDYLNSPSTDAVLNHFKPQYWFLPESVFSRDGVIILDVKNASRIKGIVEEKLNTEFVVDYGRRNVSSKKDIEFDMNDDDIRKELMDLIPAEFDFFENALSKEYPE